MLEEILKRKRIEVESVKEEVPLRELEKMPRRTKLEPPSLTGALSCPDPALIAEIKYKSPSRGMFTCRDKPESIAESYVRAGASALSVLTDEFFFSGRLEYLERSRSYLDEIEAGKQVPLLRKDFVIDRYQIEEARIRGASAFLLIAAALSDSDLAALLEYGDAAGLEALVEIHSPNELDRVMKTGAEIIGVNNRNLKTFEVDIDTSFDIARRLEGESGLILVAESGISESVQVRELADAGFDGFLVGSAFMDTQDPGRALGELLDGIK